MRAVLPMLLLAGCVSEAEKTLQTWEGIYRFTRVAENTEDCGGQTEEITLEHSHFELDSVEGIDAHLIELRACFGPDECDPTGFLTWLAPDAGEKRLDGTRDETFFTVVGQSGGLCQALHEEIEVRRSSAAKGDLTVTVFSAIATDVEASSQAVCDGLLSEMANDPDGCDALRVFEGRKVD